jgi:hypothetical protein
LLRRVVFNPKNLKSGGKVLYIGCEGRIHWPIAKMVRGRREGKKILKFWGKGKG